MSNDFNSYDTGRLAYSPTPATAAATARPTSTIQLQNGRLSKIKWVQTACAVYI